MPTELPRRRDDESEWHDLVAGECPSCECTFYRARDDPEIIWEPGDAWDEGCGDHACRCHADPVIGSRAGVDRRADASRSSGGEG